MNETMNESAIVETAGVAVEAPAEPAVEQQPVTAEVQSSEDNARYAAARRRAESEAQAKYERRLNEMNRRFAALAKANGVTDVEDAESYLKRVEEESLDARLKENQLTGEDIRKMVSDLVENNPLVVEARETTVRAQMEADIKRITKIDPDIKSADDLYASESFQDVLKAVQEQNLNVYDAYRLVNFDRLMEKNGNASKQAAINQARGKSHMEPVGGTADPASNEKEIPEKALSKWKRAYPNLTHEQLRKKYNDAIS
jgi:hypothetical protein